jgi:hypothetical protein
MNTRPTEHRYPASRRDGLEHIDLTRRLPSLKASLTPDQHTPAARPRLYPIQQNHPHNTFVPALLAWLLILAAIATLVFAHFPSTP